MSKYCPCARHRLPESVSARRRRPRSLVRVSRVSRSPRLAHRAVRLPRLVSLDPLRARLVQLDELFALRHALLLHLGLVIDRFVVVVLHVRPVVASSSSRSSSVVAIDVVASFGASFARARARRSPARVVRPRGAPAVARTSFSRVRVAVCRRDRSSDRRGARARSSPHTATRVARPRPVPRAFARARFASPFRAVSSLERARRRRRARIRRARRRARDDGGHDARDAGPALGARSTDRAGAAIDAKSFRASRTARGGGRARSRRARARANDGARRRWVGRRTRRARRARSRRLTNARCARSETGWTAAGRILRDSIRTANSEHGTDGRGAARGVRRDVYVRVLSNRRRKPREARGQGGEDLSASGDRAVFASGGR